MRNSRFFKTAATTVLTVAMTVSNVAMIAPMAADTGSTVSVPKAFWTVDFDNGYEDLQTDPKFRVVDNDAKPELVKETINGDEYTVLKLNKSTGNEVRITNYYNTNLLAGYENNSTIELSNPFASLGADYFNEYDELADPNKGLTTVRYNGKYQPLWTKGATISYWIKSPEAAEKDDYGRVVGLNSSIMTWELDDYQFQADDYAKYLVCKKYDLEIASLPEGDYNESGVPETSDFWFATVKDENGETVIYEDNTGFEGPVYGTESHINNSFGQYYFCNPKYQQGFQGSDPSNYEKMYHSNYYNEGYNTLPQWVDDGNGVGHFDFGASRVRVAKTHGNMQIDANGSFYWNNDDQLGINLNRNQPSSFGTQAGMQNGDCFFLTSYQESDDTTAKNAKYLAPSPYSEPGEWHMVTMTLQNDWIEVYLDGEIINNESGQGVEELYSSRGGITLDTSKSFKRFNKGSGMRGGAGSEKNMGTIFFGNYVCRLFMDWLTNPDTTFTIGGVTVTNGGAGMYNTSVVTDEVEIANMAFFDVVLDDDQIAEIYNRGVKGALSGDDTNVVYGDVDANGKVDASDALAILKDIVKIAPLSDAQVPAADVDGDGSVAIADALLILQKVVNLIPKFPVEG